MEQDKYTEARNIIETIEKRYAHPKQCYSDGEFSHCDVRILDGAVSYLDEELKRLKTSQNSMKCFYAAEYLPKVFIAIYGDGSGCNIFSEHKHHKGEYTGLSVDFEPVNTDWFTDAGYLWFIALPDNFNVFGGE